MQFFVWLALLITIVVAIFAIQNSTLPLLTMKFLFWQIETSPVYAMLASLVVGILIMALICLPGALRGSFAKRDLRKEIELLQKKAAREEDTKRTPGT